MKLDYKEKFYSQYVSSHNRNLYNNVPSIEGFRKQFPVWRSQYGNVLPNEKSFAIVDLGCGDGGLVYWLQEIGFTNVQGIDVSSEQVAAAEQVGVQNVIRADIRDFLKDKKNTYEIIFLRDTLGHFLKEEILEILELIYKSLRREGNVIIKTPNAESPLSGRLRYGDFTHDVSFTESSLRQILLVIGFKDVSTYSTPPVVHGLKSAVRFILWRIIELFLRVYRLVDAGTGKGIFTQNIIAVARK